MFKQADWFDLGYDYDTHARNIRFFPGACSQECDTANLWLGGYQDTILTEPQLGMLFVVYFLGSL